jgi:hypothetical protein
MRLDVNLKDIKANCTRCNIDIGVKTWGFKLDDRWYIGIVWRKVYGNFERHSGVILGIGYNL